MDRYEVVVPGYAESPRLGTIWALDLSNAAQAAVVDGQLPVPAWVFLALRESFLLAETTETNPAAQQAIGTQLGWTEADLDAVSVVAAKAHLAQRTALRLQVSASGVPGRPGYALDARWSAANNQVLLVAPAVTGLQLRRRASAEPETLTASQARVLALLEQFRGQLGQSQAMDRRVAALLQTCSGDGIEFRGALGSIQISQVESIRPTLRADGKGWRLGAEIPGLAQPADAPAAPFHAVSAGDGFSLVTRSGQASTSLLVPAASRALQRAGQLSRSPLSTDQVAQIVSRPEALLGAGFDLSEFSDRVVGIGPPVARTSVVLRETQPEAWWTEQLVLQLQPHDGQDVEGHGEDRWSESGADDQAADELRLDADMAATLAKKIEDADARGEAWIGVNDQLVRIDQALRDAVLQAQTLEAERDSKGRLPRPARQVLQLHDNVEALTYDRKLALRTQPPPFQERPPNLRADVALKPHQQEGIAWLRHAHLSRAPGVLLADDMGLGKTLQVLAFLDHLRNQEPTTNTLVVAPAGLLENWRQEASRYFGARFQPMLVAPDQRDFAGDIEYVRARMVSHPLVLISYETMVRQQSVLGRIPWRVVVADEAHRAKNPATQTWNALAGLRADFRIAMTGTPVENGLQELWAVLEAVQPGLLGSLRRFGEAYIKPLRGAGRETQLALSHQLHEAIQGVFLRRMKRDVLGADLPPKTVESRHVPLSPAQRERYGTVVQNVTGGSVLGAIQALMMLSAHPELRPLTTVELAPLAEHPFPKGEALLALLDEAAAAGEKVLVFATWKAIQAWIAREIETRFGIETPIINGDIDNSMERVHIIDRFSAREGFAALVLSPRAAGVGLNITAASHVIHYTREWNPAVEDQATDRAWRMGQTRRVRVTTIATTFGPDIDEPTVEERLGELLDGKRELASAFLVPVGASAVSAGELGLGLLRRGESAGIGVAEA